MSKATQAPIIDRSLFYSDLSFMPEGLKESRLWMAMSLFNSKQNAVRFLSPERAQKYRRLNVMDINEQEYKNMIDPPTPMGGGGEAKYFASDFKDFPIAVHIKNIRQARLDKIPLENNIQVNEIDKFAKSQRQKDKEKIIYQRAARMMIEEIINDLGGAKSGFPPLSPSETPYQYIDRLQNQKTGKKVDDLSLLLDQIRVRMKDAPDYWAIYDRYIYKGDIERAFELGIKHYLLDQNKWRLISEFFNRDIENFNRVCGEWYIDMTTGRGVVRYLDPQYLWTSRFKQIDGSDIQYWFYEEYVTFADFIKMFAMTLTDQQIKEVLLLNKSSISAGTANSVEYEIERWSSWNMSQRDNSLIKVGKFSVLTQELNAFSETYFPDMNFAWEPRPSTWEPDKDSAEIKQQRAYNVWYSCYYIPPPQSKYISNAVSDWNWQSQYIFNIQKEIDMYRYGVDQRYAKSSLVIYKSDKPSCTDIEEAYMPKIRTMWHKFQNCLVQDTNAVVIDWDFMMGILNATDEANNNPNSNDENPTGGNGINAGLEQFRMMRQGGIAFMKFRDKNGNYPPGFDPSKFFVNIDTKHLDKAEKYLTIILQQYELMKSALAESDITEGQTPKPRTPVDGIKASLESSKNAFWFVEKPVREFLIMYGERVVQHILQMTKERDKYAYTKRWEEFEDVVGLAHALMIEGVSDLDPEDIGLTVSLEDTQAMREYIFMMANEMVKNKEVSREGAMLAIETANTNYKYAFALLMLEGKRQEERNAELAEREHEKQMELGQQQLQIAITLQQAKDQGKNSNIEMQGKIDEILQNQMIQGKAQTMLQQDQQRNTLKQQENEQKARLDIEKEQQKAIEV